MDMIPVVNHQVGSWWKFLQFPVTRLVLAVLAVALSVAALGGIGALLGIVPHTVSRAVLGLFVIAGVLLSYSGYVHLIERRRVVELGSRGSLQELAFGILIGAGLFCTMMLILWLCGAWSYTSMSGWNSLVYPAFNGTVEAVIEETVFRGILFRILEESLGSWIALAISAAVFGITHAFNPGATLVSTTAIALEAGVMLAAAYMYTRRLWLVIGLHAAWNFTEGGVFAASVSGFKAEGLINIHFLGSDLITGGAFGPEASLISIAVCLAAGIVFILLARRSGRVVPAM